MPVPVNNSCCFDVLPGFKTSDPGADGRKCKGVNNESSWAQDVSLSYGV